MNKENRSCITKKKRTKITDGNRAHWDILYHMMKAAASESLIASKCINKTRAQRSDRIASE